MLDRVALSEDLARIAAAAEGYATGEEELEGVIAAEPGAGLRVYLCSFVAGETRTWLGLDDVGEPVERRSLVREAVSIAALCELAAEIAGGGDLEDVRAQLVALRMRENPPGIDQAEEAALTLERVVGVPPRLATPGYLDQVGTATRRLEVALGQDGPSPFAEAMRGAVAAVDALTREVETGYKRPLG
jgi:hypothetical protein